MDEDPNLFCFFVSPCRISPAAGRENPTIEYQSFQCQAEFHRRGKRESGVNPERSGHCKRGDGLQSHCAMHEKAQPMSMIREPGNLLKNLCIASGESVFAYRLAVLFRHIRLLFRKKGQAFFAAHDYRLFGGFWPMNEMPLDRYKERKLFL